MVVPRTSFRSRAHEEILCVGRKGRVRLSHLCYCSPMIFYLTGRGKKGAFGYVRHSCRDAYEGALELMDEGCTWVCISDEGNNLFSPEEFKEAYLAKRH